MRANIAQATK